MTGFYFFSRLFFLIGRETNPPPQFGQTFCSKQPAKKVRSKLQILAFVLSGESSLLHCSQEGLNIAKVLVHQNIKKINFLLAFSLRSFFLDSYFFVFKK